MKASTYMAEKCSLFRTLLDLSFVQSVTMEMFVNVFIKSLTGVP